MDTKDSALILSAIAVANLIDAQMKDVLARAVSLVNLDRAGKAEAFDAEVNALEAVLTTAGVLQPRPVPNSQPSPFSLNEMQRAALQTYCGGEFAHLVDVKSQAELDHELERCDGLLHFVMVELSDSEDCESPEVGADRMRALSNDLDGIADAVLAVDRQATAPRATESAR